MAGRFIPRWLYAWGCAGAFLLVPMLGQAESSLDASAATARLGVTIVIPPVFRVLQVTPTTEGYDYRVWTNMKSIVIAGQKHRFAQIGENRLQLRATPHDVWVVHGL